MSPARIQAATIGAVVPFLSCSTRGPRAAAGAVALPGAGSSPRRELVGRCVDMVLSPVRSGRECPVRERTGRQVGDLPDGCLRRSCDRAGPVHVGRVGGEEGAQGGSGVVHLHRAQSLHPWNPRSAAGRPRGAARGTCLPPRRLQAGWRAARPGTSGPRHLQPPAHRGSRCRRSTSVGLRRDLRASVPARSRTGVEELSATVARLRCHVCRPSAVPAAHQAARPGRQAIRRGRGRT